MITENEAKLETLRNAAPSAPPSPLSQQEQREQQFKTQADTHSAACQSSSPVSDLLFQPAIHLISN